MKKSARLFAFLFLTGFLLLSYSPFVFAQQSELQYPEVTGAESPNTTRELPKVIKYLFNFGLAISGFIAFGAFVYGGIKYLLSAGNPSALGDARDQIFASLLGIIVLFGSYMLLTTINPQLVVLQIPTTGSARGGVTLYTYPDCTSSEANDYIRVKSNLSNIPGSFPDFAKNPIKSIKFFNSTEELDVSLFTETDFKPSPPVWNSVENYTKANGEIPASLSESDPRGCINIEAKAKSIQLSWKSPGVYLFAGDDCSGDARLFAGNTASIGDGFDNQARSLKIIPALKRIPEQPQGFLDGILGFLENNVTVLARSIDLPEGLGGGNAEIQSKFGAILYEHENFKGDAAVFLGGTENSDDVQQFPTSCIPLSRACGETKEPYCVDGVDLDGKVSSIRTFKQNVNGGDPGGTGVTVFSNFFFNDQENAGQTNIHCGPINAGNSSRLAGSRPLWVDENSSFAGNCPKLFNPSIVSSIAVNGNYIAVLFREDGRGEAFYAPTGDIRLKDNHIGDDKAKFLLVIPLQPQ